MNYNFTDRIAIIGGGNMGTAIIGGLLNSGTPADQLIAVEPVAHSQQRLQDQHKIECLDRASAILKECGAIIWAVKPQSFAEASQEVATHLTNPLHISVMAGIRCQSIARRTKAERIVRSMPNTPALIGKGIAALFANKRTTEQDKNFAEYLFTTIGQYLWVDREALLDPVTALSGSAELALLSGESLEVLRERVTSRGGTTAAALAILHEQKVASAFEKAIHAASHRAFELGNALELEQ